MIRETMSVSLLAVSSAELATRLTEGDNERLSARAARHLTPDGKRDVASTPQ